MPSQNSSKPAKATRKKAAMTLAACLLLVVLCVAGALWVKADHDAKAAAEAARVAAELAAAEAEAQRLAEEQAALEAAAKAAEEEAARLAAEQAAAEAQAKAEEEARDAALEAAATAKESVRYGSRVGTVWVEGTKVNCGLYWGDSMSIMDAGAGCSADNGCVLPGENGTVFIGAHTGSFFSDLKSTQRGAIIHLDTDWGDFQYQVTDLKVIYETQVDLCRWGDTAPNCILYTCYPFGILTPTNQRYLVYAEPINTDENGVIPVLPSQGD